KIKAEKSDIPKGILSNWVAKLDEFHCFGHHDDMYIFPKRYEHDLKYLQNVLYLKNAGTNIGKLNRKELIPGHALALSNSLIPDFQCVELSLQDAQNY